MGLHYSPRIVREGLVYCSDPINIRSYSGSGTTLNDICGQNNTGTLTNGPVYTSTNPGYFTYDGTDDFVNISTLNSIPSGNSGSTLSGWAYTTTTTGNHWIISHGTAASSQSRFIGIVNNTYCFGGFSDNIIASGVVANTWFNMTGVYTRTHALLYVNGILVSGPTSKTWNTGTTNFQLGRQTNGTEYWQGRISHTSVYNIPLSSEQVAQNFNALRGRFGL